MVSNVRIILIKTSTYVSRHTFSKTHVLNSAKYKIDVCSYCGSHYYISLLLSFSCDNTEIGLFEDCFPLFISWCEEAIP